MTLKPQLSEERISEVAVAIVAALRSHVANEHKSTVNKAAAQTQAYKAGLTNAETQIAIIRALALLQIEQSVKFAGLLVDEEDE